MAAFPIRTDKKLSPPFSEKIGDKKINQSGEFQVSDSIIGSSTTTDPRESWNDVKKELSVGSSTTNNPRKIESWNKVKKELSVGSSSTNNPRKIKGWNYVKKEVSDWSDVKQEDFGVNKELPDCSDVKQEKILDSNFIKKEIFYNEGSEFEKAGGDGDKNTPGVTYESPSLSTTSDASKPETIFELSGCTGCMNYIMVVKGTRFCFKCGQPLVLFGWEG